MKSRGIRGSRGLALGSAIAVLSVVALAQEKEDRTLLTNEQMNAIINEASGERAMHHVLELVPYQFVRPPSEYQGHFRESEVMAKLAKEYGFSNVTIEDFPTGQTWQPVVGELWMTTPRPEKIYDLHDIPESVASMNANVDITGELISVGQGTAQDFDGKDVKGKFVLSLAPSGLGGVYQRAVAAGAIGALGISAIGAGDRAVDYPDEIVSTNVQAQPGTAAWALSPRKARALETLLARGQKVTIRSINKAEQVPNKQEIVHAEIPGDGSTTQEVAIGGHLFEGYIKQGANDDNSGCALTLEVGRAYIKLIKEAKLPKPKRTIDFQWVQEISGTNAWLNAHPEKQKVLIGDLNFDMEALRLTMSRSYWIMQRTPDTFPSYINDVGQSFMEYISELTRERVRYRANGYQPVWNITSPNGSDDAFYIKIDQHYGSSDHVTYMQHGVPAVMFITWPDMWYHSSQDTPDKQDPTQYKRAASVAIGALAAIATGGDTVAARVTSENLARGTERLGGNERKGTAYLADAMTPEQLHEAWKEARVAIRHQAGVEKSVVRSSGVLYDDPAGAAKSLMALEAAIDRKAAALLDEAKAAYALHAARLHTSPVYDPPETAAEREAANLIVQCSGQATFAGCGGGRGGGAGGGGGGAGRAQGAGAGGAGRAAAGGRGAAGGPALPQHMNAEFNILLGKKLSALEIRDFLSGEFEPVPLADVMAVLRARETAGTIKLVAK
jgi:Zn-dependent M28 family amino/carboxypeptidase